MKSDFSRNSYYEETSNFICIANHLTFRFTQVSTEKLLIEVCKDVRVEPQLQQLTGEYIQYSTAAGNEVRLDIIARGLWQAGQMAFLDVRVFNPNAKRYANIELSEAYEIDEKDKKKTYNAFFRSSMEVSHLW